jgi:PAS domain S-box-containing protein
MRLSDHPHVGVDRLTIRLAVGITLLVVCPLAFGLYALSRLHLQRTIEARRDAAAMQNLVLEAALRQRMIRGDHKLVPKLLQEIGTQPDVRGAMILDHDGVVRFASRAGLVGKKLSPKEEGTCMTCHSLEPGERKHWALIDQGAGLRTVLPLENRAECHKCHDPGKRLNGILILDVSLAEAQARLRRDTAWIAAGTVGLALLLLGGMALVLRQLVLVRLARLGRTARSIASGELGQRAVVDGNDMITTVAAEFNNMAASVSRLVQEVRDQEAQLRSVLNSVDDGLIVLDDDYRVVAANHSFCKRFGVPPETLSGLRCRETGRCVLDSGRDGAGCPTTQCMVSGEVQRAVVRVGSEDRDTEIVEEIHSSPVFDEDGKVVQVVEVWRDISDRVKEQERLAEVERLVSLGALASGFSHEINTPLASVLICAEAVINRIDDPDSKRDAETMLSAIRDHADIIRKEILRCRRITEQFLRFSRGIPPSVEPIDLRAVVESVIALVAPTAREAGASVCVTGDERLPAVSANVEVVQHVLVNLLVNAIESLGDRGGAVTVGFRAGEDVRILVSDTGSGIPQEVCKHLFEPFRSSKRHGTGLGLFLSRSFARRFGGDLHMVRSEVGVGSCFEVVFRRASAEAA